MSDFSGEVIQIRPTRILGFGINAEAAGMTARDVPGTSPGQLVETPIQEPIR